MQIRRSARVIVGLTGVVVVWYALTTGLLDPRRRSKRESGGASPVLAGRVTRDGESVTALVEIRNAPLPEPLLAGGLALPFGEDPPAATVETREDGAFEFSGVPAGRYEVTATGPEGATARVWVAYDPESEESPVVLALETGTGDLTARAVTAAGAPFDGYVLAYTRGDPSDAGGTWTPAVQPDGKGAFEILGFPRPRVCLSFLAPGTLRVLVPAVSMAGGVLVVDRDLSSHEGVVRDEAGGPVAGARVLVRSRDEPTGREAVHAAVSDARGRFVTRMLPVPLEWVASAEGFEAAGGEPYPDGPIVLRGSR